MSPGGVGLLVAVSRPGRIPRSCRGGSDGGREAGVCVSRRREPRRGRRRVGGPWPPSPCRRGRGRSPRRGGRRSPAGAGGTRLRPASALHARAPGAPQPGEYAPAGALPVPRPRPRAPRRLGGLAALCSLAAAGAPLRRVSAGRGAEWRGVPVSRPRGAAPAGQSSVARGSWRNRSGLCPCRRYGRGRCGGAAGACLCAGAPGLSGLPGAGQREQPWYQHCLVPGAARGSAAGSGELIHGCGTGCSRPRLPFL